MPDQPNRCPLCGGELYDYDGFPGRCCDDCGLTSEGWPRIAALVAIRDAVLRWDAARVAVDKFHNHESYKEVQEAAEELVRLAREELERQSKEADSASEDATD